MFARRNDPNRTYATSHYAWHIVSCFHLHLKQVKASSVELKSEVKEDLRKAVVSSDQRYGELKDEIRSVRKKVTSILVEMHDVNGASTASRACL